MGEQDAEGGDEEGEGGVGEDDGAGLHGEVEAQTGG